MWLGTSGCMCFIWYFYPIEIKRANKRHWVKKRDIHNLLYYTFYRLITFHLYCEEMTTFWPNYSKTYIFYQLFIKIVHVPVIGPVLTRPNTFWPFLAFPDLSWPFPTFPDLLRSNENKQAQNLCIDASVDQFWKELKKAKNFEMFWSLLKRFKIWTHWEFVQI